MKRKVLGLFLAISFAVSTLSGCTSGSKKDTKAIETLEDAIEKSNKASANNGSMDMKVATEAEDEEFSIEMKMDFNVNNADDVDNMEAVFKMESKAYGQKATGTMYVANGKTYMDMMGMKMIVPDESIDSFSSQVAITKIDADTIESATLKEKDGKKTIKIELKEEAVKDLVLKNLGSQMGDLDIKDEDIKIDEFSLVYVVGDDGYIYGQDLSFTIKLIVGSEAGMVSANMNLEITTYEEQTIEFPDFSDYVEEY